MSCTGAARSKPSFNVDTATSAVLGDARALQPELVRIRHELHRDPELGLVLPRTQERVLAELDDLGLEVSTGDAVSSVTAVLRGNASGPTSRTVLLRADMDGLPVSEDTGETFSSTNENMHACGHDLHTAMLLGAAKVLTGRRERLAGDVVFMFQPGEEGHDGARHMLAEGVLDAAGRRPDAAYALHVTSAGIPLGTFTTKSGPMMAASSVLRVTVRGRGGHGSAPHLGADPIPAACEMVTALQTFVTRGFDVFDPVVLTVGMIRGGSKNNVIPDSVEFEATARAFSQVAQEKLAEGGKRVCAGIASAHGLSVNVEFSELHPVTCNDDAEAEFVGAALRETHGENRYVPAPQPLTASEDFSYVLGEIPGAMVFLGACPPDLDRANAPFNHSPRARFDDTVLADGAAAYAGLAVRRLHHA